MGSNVFLIDDQGGLNPLDHTPFEKERQLDSYVENYPQLLASALSTDEDELRFVLLERQAGIDDSDAGRSGRWAADAIFLDQTGTLTIVEDKLSHNPEIRRKMVGQMIEYAANLLDTFTVDGVRERLAQTHEDVDAAIAHLLGEPELFEADTNATEVLWRNVERNLQAGAIRMVFVADRLPHELRRIIEFLNQYMNPMEIVGVQISRMRDGAKPGGAEVLVTSVIGKTERGGKVPPPPKPPPWNKDTFFSELSNSVGEDDVGIVKRLLACCESSGGEIGWGAGATTGRFSSRWPAVCHRSVLSVTTDGHLNFHFGGLHGNEKAEQFRNGYFDLVTQLGFNLPTREEAKFPHFPIEEWGPKVDAFMGGLKKLLKPEAASSRDNP